MKKFIFIIVFFAAACNEESQQPNVEDFRMEYHYVIDYYVDAYGNCYSVINGPSTIHAGPSHTTIPCEKSPFAPKK